jgi:hypothetical protein
MQERKPERRLFTYLTSEQFLALSPEVRAEYLRRVNAHLEELSRLAGLTAPPKEPG